MTLQPVTLQPRHCSRDPAMPMPAAGVLYMLQDLGIIQPNTPMAGASSGAITCRTALLRHQRS